MASKGRLTSTLALVAERYSLVLSGKWVGSTEHVPATKYWNVFVSGTALGLTEADSYIDRAESSEEACERANAAVAKRLPSPPIKKRALKKTK